MSTGASPQMSNYPMGFANGVTLRNVPITPVQPGSVFWVYNGTSLPPGGVGGSDNNPGTFQKPFSTIAGALTHCLAGRGDIIFVKPGHAETVGSATAMALNVAGVQIIGLGVGVTRPKLTLGTATTATIAVSAAQMALRNFNLDFTGIDAVAAGITVTGDDFQLTDCAVTMATASAQCVLGVNAAASGLVVNGCKFLGTTDAGTTTAIQFVGGDNIQITNNFLMGAYNASAGGIRNNTTAATNVLIAGNYINNLTASSTKAFTAAAATTGFISDNRMQILSGTAPITAAAMSWVGGNYYAATIATAGTLI